MKAITFGATAGAAVLAGSLFLTPAPAQASTVSVTYNYLYFVSGPHQRQPRSNGGSGFASIQSLSGGQSATGLTFQPGVLPGAEPVNGQSYKFAFVTVVGGTPVAGGAAGATSTNANAPPAVVVGTAPIVVQVIYVPSGGGPGPPPTDSGATIDSFDETTGALFSDTFVSVAPDPSGALTKSGNVEGYVDTWNSAETITALTPTSPTGVNFSRWVNLGPPATPSSNPALTVAKGSSVLALAFYDAPAIPIQSTTQAVCTQEADNLQLIITDRGPLLLVNQYNQVVAALEKCVAERYLTQAYVTNLETEYRNMAESRSGAQPVPTPH